jgi:aminoglycoside phosphotransferase (APT) family kinase protein
MAFPPAEGSRIAWADMPAAVRNAIERRLGARVASAVSLRGGFSPGVAARVRTVDGRVAFVKAASPHPNPHTPALHRREARIATLLPAAAPAPRLHWSYDDGDWIVLAFEHIQGECPRLPWRARELARVLDMLTELASCLTPSPAPIETVADRMRDSLTQWRVLEQHGREVDELARLYPDAPGRLRELTALEAQWPAAAAGDTLLHMDVRADNVLLGRDRCYLVDWPWAAVGAPWLDLVAMLPSVAMQGGPDPESIWRVHPLARGVDGEALDTFVAAVAGYLARESLQPPSPGLPTLRPFQRGQAEAALRWLAGRRHW